MAKVAVYNMEGKEVDSIELNDSIFGIEINEHLVHMAVLQQLANNRQGTQKAKTRSEVRGGGRKPWRQKGTGHARQGSTRSPQWTGGGVVTFKNAKKLKETVQYAPLSQLVLETDCPYMSPEPNRGKRNSSLNLPYVAQAIAELKGITAEEVIDVTRQNAEKLLGIHQ